MTFLLPFVTKFNLCRVVVDVDDDDVGDILECDVVMACDMDVSITTVDDFETVEDEMMACRSMLALPVHGVFAEDNAAVCQLLSVCHPVQVVTPSVVDWVSGRVVVDVDDDDVGDILECDVVMACDMDVSITTVDDFETVEDEMMACRSMLALPVHGVFAEDNAAVCQLLSVCHPVQVVTPSVVDWVSGRVVVDVDDDDVGDILECDVVMACDMDVSITTVDDFETVEDEMMACRSMLALPVHGVFAEDNAAVCQLLSVCHPVQVVTPSVVDWVSGYMAANILFTIDICGLWLRGQGVGRVVQ
ncbi:hypothetical protein LR48_Vigan358s000600 [Vigna angularis]|uniref:Uncharacterized protein n=1 Tax=Phaseolus angularis TaxID=3914 RepID=A0A0L9T8X8_PHAAN|nr:hypothetical protein LR48_Vigan358s000600 [Vigna angularis]